MRNPRIDTRLVTVDDREIEGRTEGGEVVVVDDGCLGESEADGRDSECDGGLVLLNGGEELHEVELGHQDDRSSVVESLVDYKFASANCTMAI